MGNGKKDITAVIILDLLVAFDTVDYNLLLGVLDKKFGIKDKALHWYEQCLKPRIFRVCINDSFSQEKQWNSVSHKGPHKVPSFLLTSTLDKVVPKDLQFNGFADDYSHLEMLQTQR